MFEKGIVDAAKVTRSALQNAASIAAMVLTTETLVTDLPGEEAGRARRRRVWRGHGLLARTDSVRGTRPSGFHAQGAEREPGPPSADARLLVWQWRCAGFHGRDRRDPPPGEGVVGCPLARRPDDEMPGGTGCPPTGAPATAIARDRRSAAGSVAGGLAVVGPVSRDLPGDCSPRRFGSECRPLRARFRIDVRPLYRKGLIHQRAVSRPDLSTFVRAPGQSVEKSRSAGWRAQAGPRGRPRSNPPANDDAAGRCEGPFASRQVPRPGLRWPLGGRL